METETIRVFVVDDHAVVRFGLAALLEGETDVEFVGDAEGADAALEQLAELDTTGLRPHVVLMDLRMEPIDGIESTRMIRERYDDVEIVVLTSFDDDNCVRSALEAGASGFLLKDADVDEVLVAVRAAHRGELQLDPAVARRLTESLRDTPSGPELTPRELDVLRLLGEGRANRTHACVEDPREARPELADAGRAVGGTGGDRRPRPAVVRRSRPSPLPHAGVLVQRQRLRGAS
jgi:DNA-binding NarL/FixJ family response regulator